MTRPAYDPAATYQFKTTAFPFTESESVPATMTEAAVAAAGIATAAKQDEILANKTGYSLSATGLDAIADPDDLTPGFVPTTFSQKLRWLIQRFWKAEKTATTILVKNEAGQTITTQAITPSGSDQTTGAPS